MASDEPGQSQTRQQAGYPDQSKPTTPQQQALEAVKNLFEEAIKQAREAPQPPAAAREAEEAIRRYGEIAAALFILPQEDLARPSPTGVAPNTPAVQNQISNTRK